MLPRESRLRSSREIREVVSRGKRASGDFATLHYKPAEDNKFAIIVSKTVGNAVVRNSVKRRMRAILADHKQHSPAVHAAFRMRPSAATAEFRDLSKEVSNLLERTR